MRKLLEKRDLAFQPDKIMRLLAETEDELAAARKEVAALQAKLSAIRQVLDG